MTVSSFFETLIVAVNHLQDRTAIPARRYQLLLGFSASIKSEFDGLDISTSSSSDKSISYESSKDNVVKISKNIYSIDGLEFLFPGHTVIPISRSYCHSLLKGGRLQ
jgi:hypothetical protein